MLRNVPDTKTQARLPDCQLSSGRTAWQRVHSDLIVKPKNIVATVARRWGSPRLATVATPGTEIAEGTPANSREFSGGRRLTKLRV